MASRVLWSGAALAPAVYAAVVIKGDSQDVQKPLPMSFAELPLYEAPHKQYKEAQAAATAGPAGEGLLDTAEAVLAVPVRAVRTQLQSAADSTGLLRTSLLDAWDKVDQNTSWMFRFLREEGSPELRYGAVAMSGMTGYVLAARASLLRRLLYTGVGASAMSWVCFPERTEAAAGEVLDTTKHYLNVLYNFAYGVKPGDPQLEIKFPQLSVPKNFSEFVDLTKGVASSLTQAVMPPPAKDDKPDSKDK